MTYPKPPSSKTKVKAAGRSIAKSTESQDEIDLVDQWRASHGYVINTFQIWLRRALERSKIEAEFAQRLKRRRTVIDKLRRKRPDGTPLIRDVTSMHDFAGCRLIFNNIEDLNNFRSELHSAKSMRNVKHKLQHDLKKYDYIEHPKSSGYRGIHDVFRHYPRAHRKGDTASMPWHGLRVEIQYRTRAQHAWATALEISDIIDGQRTKFDLVTDDRGRFFALASELIARRKEGMEKSYLDLSSAEIVARLKGLDDELGVLQRLKALREFDGFQSLRRHSVLNIKQQPDGVLVLDVSNFRNPNLAIEHANNLENDNTSVNAVYVRADNPSQLRSAYRNYFNDPVDFVQMLEEET